MTDADSLIKELETASFRAWPAREVQEYRGWILRADKGITRRANSVFPKSFKNGNLDKAIAYVIEFYKKRKLPAFFQMTRTSQPDELDEKLANWGFVKELQVYVQTVEIACVYPVETTVRVEISSHITKTWLTCYGAATGYDEKSLLARKEIMTRVKQPKAFALAWVENEPAGVGFGVVDSIWVGLFSIATHKQHRRQGVATAISRSLMEWGRKQNARRAYLQVEVDNQPALNLYRKLGFSTQYLYWYRLLK